MRRATLTQEPDSRECESRRPRELNVELARGGRGTLRSRLADAIRAAIRDGALRPGEPLPSTRALAEQLGVSRGVTSDVFQQLAAGGYIELRARATAQVSAGAAVQASAGEALPAGAARYSYSLLSGDLSLFPRGDWLRCVQTVLRTVPDGELDYGDPLGHATLRAELSAYLRRTRGVVADENRVLITQGNTQALDIVLRVLATRGSRRIALENPSYQGPWSAARRAGLQTLPLEVDDQGACTTHARRAGAGRRPAQPRASVPAQAAETAGMRAPGLSLRNATPPG